MKPASVPLRGSPPLIAALIIAGLGAAAIAGAYVFEYGFKLLPCPLCLAQRTPYYVSIPLALAVAAGAYARAPRALLAGALLAIALVMLWGAGLGVYHSGVEWKWWAGPTDCAAPMASLGSGGSLLQQLQQTTVVRCDEAAWRFLGLSLAGYNVLISLGLALVALWGALARRRPFDA